MEYGARELEDGLHDLFEELIDAAGGDGEAACLAEAVEGFTRVGTFAQEGVLTRDRGLVLHRADGTRFFLTITEG